MKLTGEHYYLDMKYPCSIHQHFDGNSLGLIGKEAEAYVGKGIDFPTAENCFQARKILYSAFTPEEKMDWLEKMASISPYDAQKLIESVPIYANKWEEQKLKEMIRVVYHKFNQNPDLSSRLMAEKGSIVVENDIGDTYWGKCNGIGENHLGNILENERAFELERYSEIASITPYKTSEVVDGHCVLKNRFILEKGKTVYNYTEIMKDCSRGKEIIITKWNKDEEDYETVKSISDEEIFKSEVSYQDIEDKFNYLLEKENEKDTDDFTM